MATDLLGREPRKQKTSYVIIWTDRNGRKRQAGRQPGWGGVGWGGGLGWG